MAQGTAAPWRADSRGRLVLVSGDPYLRDLIGTALGSGDSDNPFQTIGLGEDVIFGINDRITEAFVRQRLTEIFAEFQRSLLAKLADDRAITFPALDEPGVLVANVRYVNLESDKVDEATFRVQTRG